MARYGLRDGDDGPEPMLSFITKATCKGTNARCGELLIKGRKPIQTPQFVGNTSRGTIPHLTQDMQEKYTGLSGLYFGLEDFVEQGPPQIAPILQTPLPDDEKSRLRRFTSHNEETTLILGPRRLPAVETPGSNSNTSMAICTSVGFRQLQLEEYLAAAVQLQPDVTVGMANVLAHESSPSQKRREKMVDDTGKWTKALLEYKSAATDSAVGGGLDSVFAPLLPIPAREQWFYLEELAQNVENAQIDGLALYDPTVAPDLPKALRSLPILSFSKPKTPLQVLREVNLGVDLFVFPFITEASDSGIVLDFVFSEPTSASTALSGPVNGERQPLGYDATISLNATDMSALVANCACYACTKHHKAYLHHLLNAKEMLAWVLLQVHNHHVVDLFFQGVRSSIANGSFEQGIALFESRYETELPQSAGQGPRLRGYQFKSQGRGEQKKNAKAYNRLDDQAEAYAEAAQEDDLKNPDLAAPTLEQHGFGETA